MNDTFICEYPGSVMADSLATPTRNGLAGGRDPLLVRSPSAELNLDDDDDVADVEASYQPSHGTADSWAPRTANIDEDEYEPLSTPPRIAGSRRSDDSSNATRTNNGVTGPLSIIPPSHHHTGYHSPDRNSPRHQPRHHTRDDSSMMYSPQVLTHPVPGSLANSVSYSNAPPLTPIHDRHGHDHYRSSHGGNGMIRSGSGSGSDGMMHQMTMPASHSHSGGSPGGRHSPRSQSMNASDMAKASQRRPVQLATMTKGPSSHPRLQSLDCVRGLTIALMILVDGAGETYNYWMDHAPWDGIHLADFVFPFFLFVSGISIPLASAKFLNPRDESPPSGGRSQSHSQVRHRGCMGCLRRTFGAPYSPRTILVYRAVIRAMKLFMIGFILQGGGFPNHYNLNTIRIPGILQRIAFCYLVVVIIEAYTPRIDVDVDPNHAVYGPSYMWLYKRYRPHWFVMGIITAVYLVLLLVTDVGGDCKPGELTAACNAAHYWDETILGRNHLYSHPTYQRLPECLVDISERPAWCSRPFDPEGILSSIMAIGSCWFGAIFGHVLLEIQPHYDRLKQWVPLSLVCMALGFILHYTCIPFNKNLWSISYTLLMAGIAGLVLSLAYYIIDIKRKSLALKPFIFMGANAILVFVGAAANLLEVVIGWFYLDNPTNNLNHWFQSTVMIGWLGQDLGVLIYIFIKIIVWLLISFVLYRKQIFWKI